MNFLNGRSYFSVGESLLDPEDVAVEAKNAGYSAVGLCDTMTLSGMPKFFTKAKALGLKPFIGARLRIVDDLASDREKGVKRHRPYYIKAFARNDAGLKELFKLLSLANDDEHFYYEARLTLDDVLNTLTADNVVIATGDVYSALGRTDYQAIIKRLTTASETLKTAFQVFAEIVPHNTPYWDRVNARALTLLSSGAIGAIVSPLAFYKASDDPESLDVIKAVVSSAKLTDGWAAKHYLRNLVLPTPKELVQEFLDISTRLLRLYERDMVEPATLKLLLLKAMTATNKFSELAEFDWKKSKPCLPVMAENEFGKLVEKCKDGWKTRFEKPVFGHKPDDLKPYQARLAYELSVLKKLSFSGYFLLVEDIVSWAKRNSILVGPGRGSVGGSLVAYLLNITDVDPLRFGLLFERFINPDRIDLPDADLDFMSERRQDVIDYVVKTYGEDKVAGVSNYGRLAASSALRDVARVFNVPMSDIAASKLVPKEHGKPLSLEEAAKEVPELDKLRASHPHVWKHAQALEGVIRNMGRHAAGIVVAGEPLIDHAIVEKRSGAPTVNWDKGLVEDFGLIKMDILGLSTLDIMKLASDMLFANTGKQIDYYDLPLDDEAVLAAFGKGETVGVFQFESPGMRKLLKDLATEAPLTFEDIAAATALYRPGPMDSGLMDDYIAIKKGYSTAYYEHPNMKAALEETFGVIIYQEQVMRLATDLAGFTLVEADHLRKAMGKKDKEKMASMRDKWVKGCIAHSEMPEDRAGALFDKVEAFAGYGFNKSHAVEYAIISYLTMYLKVRYPAYFYAACLTVMKEDRLSALLMDAQLRGISVLPPDVNHSTNRFEILTETKLLIPLNRVKGISDNTALHIMERRGDTPFVDYTDFEKRTEARKCNIKAKTSLRLVGALSSIDPTEKPSTDPSRIKDQVELLPGLMTENVAIDRMIDLTPGLVRDLIQTVQSWRSCEKCHLKDGCHPKPMVGKKAKFMIVLDGPNWQEDRADQIGKGDMFDFVAESLNEVGIPKDFVYVTTLVKSIKPKTDKTYSNEALNACPEWLDQEIALLKPSIIVALGTNAARHFVKSMKGGIIDHAGKVIYDKARDANIVIGINPAQIAFDATKQKVLDDVFVKVAEILVA